MKATTKRFYVKALKAQPAISENSDGVLRQLDFASESTANLVLEAALRQQCANYGHIQLIADRYFVRVNFVR